MEDFGLYWFGWFVISLLGFAIVEFISIADKTPNNTLSANIRKWLGINPQKDYRRIAVPAFIAAVAVFALWFIPHIVSTVGDMS
jgi:hypothetical protein